jgi:hypothetical protein
VSREAIAATAVEIHNHTVLLGQHYKALLEQLAEYRKAAYREGGANAVEDFLNVAGPARVMSDLIGLMVAAGLGPVLVAANGRQDHARVLNFADRYVTLASQTDGLTTHRGQPNPDPLSAHRHMPGVKVGKEA